MADTVDWVAEGGSGGMSAPIITAGQTFTGRFGEAFSETLALTDSENRPVTGWSATGLPAWASISATTGAITGTPLSSASTTVSVTATGPGGTSTSNVTIVIANFSWSEGVYASDSGIACPLLIWGYPGIGEGGPIKASDLDPDDLAASDWVVSGSVPASGSALATNKVIEHRMDNGIYLANWPYGGDVIVNLLRIEMNGSSFYGEFLVHPKFTGNLEVVLDTFVQGEACALSTVNLGVKFFPYVTDSELSGYRSGASSEWDYEIHGGDEGYGLWPALGCFGVFRLTRAIPDDMGSVIAALRMRLIY